MQPAAIGHGEQISRVGGTRWRKPMCPRYCSATFGAGCDREVLWRRCRVKPLEKRPPTSLRACGFPPPTLAVVGESPRESGVNLFPLVDNG